MILTFVLFSAAFAMCENATTATACGQAGAAKGGVFHACVW